MGALLVPPPRSGRAGLIALRALVCGARSPAGETLVALLEPTQQHKRLTANSGAAYASSLTIAIKRMASSRVLYIENPTRTSEPPGTLRTSTGRGA